MENKKSISSLGALALSIGTAIGWGSFAVTSSSFLSKSGPLGSIIGLLLGMVFMLVIAHVFLSPLSKYLFQHVHLSQMSHLSLTTISL